MADKIIIRNYEGKDLEDVHAIFNHFALNSFAVYSDSELQIDPIRKMMQQAKVALVLQLDEIVIGIGFISEFKPDPNFSKTGILTYFIKPEFTGMGIGRRLFNDLLSKGKERGITNYLAHISSKNEQSLSFHKKLGFQQSGRFKNVGIKFGESIDIIWMQNEFD